eukprot:gene4755-4927_t
MYPDGAAGTPETNGFHQRRWRSGLGHASAEEHAELFFFRGLARVTEPGSPLNRMLKQMTFSWDQIGTLVDLIIAPHDSSTEPATMQSVNRYAESKVASIEKSLEAANRERQDSILTHSRQNLPRGTADRNAALEDVGSRVNLLVEWSSAPPQPPYTWMENDILFPAIAFLLHIPVHWPAADGSDGAVAQGKFDPAKYNVSDTPSKSVDLWGIHALTCNSAVGKGGVS